MDQDRFARYDQCLDEVLDLLGLVPPPRPAGERYHSRRARREWQGRAAMLITREAQPPLPDELFEPLVRAGVYEPDPSHTLRHIGPAVAAFGRRRVQTRLLEYLRTGTDYEIGGAADAWYTSWVRDDDDGTPDDPCVDLQREFQETGLRVFLANPDPRVRYRLISLLNLQPDDNPAELQSLVTEVLNVARTHPDDTLTSRIRRSI